MGAKGRRRMLPHHMLAWAPCPATETVATVLSFPTVRWRDEVSQKASADSAARMKEETMVKEEVKKNCMALKKTMKTSAVSATVRVAQILSACVWLLTPRCLSSVATEPLAATPTWAHALSMAAVSHARGIQSTNVLGTVPYAVESLTQTDVLPNPAAWSSSDSETGTWPGPSVTGRGVEPGTKSGVNHWESTVGPELLTTRTQPPARSSWTSLASPGGEERMGTRLSTSTGGFSTDSFPTQDWAFLKLTAGLKQRETGAVTEHSASHETDTVTRTTAWSPQTEEAGVGRESKHETKETRSTSVALVNFTEDSGVTQRIKGSYNLTMEKQDPVYATQSHDTTPNQLIAQTSQTHSGISTRADGNTVTDTASDLSTEVTTRHFNTALTSVHTAHSEVYSKILSTKTMEELFISNSSGSPVSAALPEVHTDQGGEQSTAESLLTSERNRPDTTAVVGVARTGATHGRRVSVWSTSVTDRSTSDYTGVAKNTSTGENVTRNDDRERPLGLWPDCLNDDSPSQSRRSSKMVCLVTLWSLGMVASVFLGLSIFLCARLSTEKQRARRMARGSGSRRGLVEATGKETQSLWLEPSVSAEERAEFWYASGATLQADGTRGERGMREERKGRKGEKRKASNGEMWTPPRVTVEDITEFWYGNRRVRNTEGLEEQCHLIRMNPQPQK